ncbi:hypothetical protein HGRIS_005102 [Hohenbuehelia grisea]|uniref:Uncharacterized protein n=1 Tax=Hohenbuehelia grisea TaxID=104357 RepID=A0ABR3JE11_9AGAR
MTITSGAVALSLAAQAYGHAAVLPPLGVAGEMTRDQVQRPTDDQPCGGINVNANLATSQRLQADDQGKFSAEVTNFDPLLDGSEQFTMKVSATASTADMVNGAISKNGPLLLFRVPERNTIEATLPNGVKCSGGPDGNLCLASFRSVSGFGNCVVIQQGPPKAAAAAAAAGQPAAGANAAAAGSGQAAAGGAPAVPPANAAVPNQAAAGANGAGAASAQAAPGGAPAAPVVNAAAPNTAAAGVAPAPVNAAAATQANAAQAGNGKALPPAAVAAPAAQSVASGAAPVAPNTGAQGAASAVPAASKAGKVIAGRTLLPRLYRERAARGIVNDNVVEKRSFSSWIWA